MGAVSTIIRILHLILHVTNWDLNTQNKMLIKCIQIAITYIAKSGILMMIKHYSNTAVINIKLQALD